MVEIVWFDKDRSHTISKSDVSIKKIPGNRVSIILRNGYAAEISKTGFFRLGLSTKQPTRLYFMAADENGWKAYETTQSGANSSIKIKGKLVDALAKFEGDYEMDLDDDNLYYIDRRKVLK